MPLNSEILDRQIADLSKAYQRQIDKAGEPEYNPTLTGLLKRDLDWLLGEQRLTINIQQLSDIEHVGALDFPALGV
ncbi:MAG: hypothetical protein Q8918_06260 [Bacteroidota bacterium]|nr:hypothetical protein [Bacteroidota bacterium]